MAVIRRTSRARSLLLLLVLVSVTLVTLDQRGGRGVLGAVRTHVQSVAKPVQRLVHDGLRPIGDFLTGAADYGSVRRQNELLHREILALQSQAVAAAAAQQRSDEVLRQAHLSFVDAIPTVAAHVIDQGPSNFENTVLIDKGTADGLVSGQPVVASGGLVGDLGAVGAHSADVRLLTDPVFVVGVSLSSALGSTSGSGQGQPLRVAFDTPPAGPNGQESSFVLKVGAAVVTSGEDLSAYPAGIPVATVATFSNPAGASQPLVTLRPLVDLSSLSLVQVELWSPQTAPKG